MTLLTDSYGTVAEVLAFTMHLMDGESNFNSTTSPTITEVEKFIDRSSAYVNISLQASGLSTPVTNTTAVLMLDDWVVSKASKMVELTQRGAGYSEGEESRTATFRAIGKDAAEFVADNLLGFKRIGVTVGHALSEGLAFTGLDDQDERDDPDDSTLEQPMFTRNKFEATDNDVVED